MKKIIMVGILFGSFNFAHAISAPSVLDGNYAYLLNPGVTAANITAASITFSDVTMTAGSSVSGGNRITVDFGSFVGINTVVVAGSPYSSWGSPNNKIGTPPTSGNFNSDRDNDASGDAYGNIPNYSGSGSGSGKQTYLGTELFPSTYVSHTWTYTFDADQLTALNAYIAAGAWGFEIDPDCHFTVGGIDFVYTQGTLSVPDTAGTFGLLGLAMGCVVAFRRKICIN